MIGSMVRGAVAGAVGTWVMDLVTTGLYDAQSEEANRREAAAHPNGKGSVENLLDRIDSVVGLELDAEQRERVVEALHYGLGVGPAVLYALVRRRLPLVRAGRGVVYGLLLWAVNDEWMNTTLGLAGPYGAYPIEAHWRGLVGHVALGVTTDTTLDLLGI